MTPELQRAEAALLAGWTQITLKEMRGLPPPELRDNTLYNRRTIPDYLVDLNAARDAVMRRWAIWPVHVRREYMERLDAFCGNRFESINATAAQRVRVLLETEGKWHTGVIFDPALTSEELATSPFRAQRNASAEGDAVRDHLDIK